MSEDLRDAVNTMNALPDIDGEDSERLREFVRVTTREVEVIGGASAGTTLEMIGYIRELEHKLNSRASVAAVGGDAIPRQEVVARIEKQIRLWNDDTVTMAFADVLTDLKSIPAAASSPAPAEELNPKESKDA